MSQKNIIEVQMLSIKSKKKQILSDVSFGVPNKSICAFIGPNGAGKTTTIKSILGLYTYNFGKITIKDIDSKNKKSRLIIGYVPEKENFPKMKVIKFLESMGEISLLKPNDVLKFVNDIRKFFDIVPLLDYRLDQLSSGQKKQVIIIQALMHNPEILIMDEPTENMDPTARQNFYKLMKTLHTKDKTIFISTHQLDEIKNFANYVVFINQGKITYSSNVKSKANLYKLYNKLNKTF